MTAYKRPVFFDRDIKSFSELSADSGLDLGIVARSILADAWLQVGTTGSAGHIAVMGSDDIQYAFMDAYSGSGVLSLKNSDAQETVYIEGQYGKASFGGSAVDGSVVVLSGNGNEAVKLDGATATATLGGAATGTLLVKNASDQSVASIQAFANYADFKLTKTDGSPLNVLSAGDYQAFNTSGQYRTYLGPGRLNLMGTDANTRAMLDTYDGYGVLKLNDASAVETIKLDGAAASITLSGAASKITGLVLSEITGSTDAASKAYVDSVAQGLAPKGACHVSSQGNLADLATTTEVDGHTLSVGERVLVRYQSNAVENGIYEFDGTGLVRTADMAAGSHAAGAFTFVQFGTNADQGWVCTADAPADVVGTDALPWTQFSAAGVIEAGDGLQLIGTVMSAKLDGTTLAASVDGLKVLGLPVEFEIDGIAVSPDFTATSIAAIVGGAASNASEWHMHQSDVLYLGADAALSAGQACIVASGQAAPAGTTSTGAYAIGVAESIAGGMARVVRSGLAFNVITGATSGEPVYVQADGTLGTLLPTSGRVVMLGIATNTTDVFVQVRDFGSILAA